MREAAGALSTIHSWVAQGGPLRTLTLSLCTGQQEFCAFAHDFYSDRSRFEKCLATLYSSWHGKQQDWGAVRRRIEISVGSWILKAVEHDPNAILAAFHDSFGGDLWVDERLCYRDGKEILRAFEFVQERQRWQSITNKTYRS
jgi:hypothetical protein